MKYSDIFLSSHYLSLLRRCQTGAVVTMYEFEAKKLLSFGFIQPYALSDNNNEYVINDEGTNYLDFLDQQYIREHLKSKSARRNTIIAYIGAITGALSLLWNILKELLR